MGVSPKQVTEILSALCATYGREPNVGMTAVWAAQLADLTEEEIARAMIEGPREWKFMPNPADFRRAAGRVAVSSAPDSKAIRAWSGVVDAMGRVGRYRSVDFGPQANAALRAIGGWVSLCEQGGDALHVWARKAFLAAYEASEGLAEGVEATGYLPGLTELDNRHRAFAVDPPTRIDLETMRELPALEAPAKAEALPDQASRDAIKRALGMIGSREGRKALAVVPRRSGSEG